DALSSRYGIGVGAPELLAYCYALLSASGFTRRFAEQLRTPGPRVPLAADYATFSRGVRLGEKALAVHTYRSLTPGRAKLAREIGEGLPTGFGYDAPQACLWLGDGCLAPVSDDVWAYGVSGYRVVSSWLRRRVRPARGKSPLDAIGLERWEARLTSELLELVWLIEHTLDLGCELDALLDEAIG
ncbi:MAG TPA: type ISP restriction/modification enzyme, partial [Chloroflexota bacterium]